jgi:hypothetical protein
MITSLICAAALGTETITIDGGCQRLPVLLKKISAQAKTELHCSAAFEDEVLFVKVKAQPVLKVMEGIAEVCHADWERVQGEQWLRRSGKRDAEDRKADEKLMVDVLRKQLADVIESPPKALTPEEEKAHFEEFERVMSRFSSLDTYAPDRGKLWKLIHKMSLAGRALDRLLAATDLSVFALSLPWQYKLYSTAPSALQTGLGAKAAATLDAFTKEKSYVIDRLLAMSPEEQGAARSRLGYSTEYLMPIAAPVNAYLRGTWVSADGFFLEAQFVDRDGYCLEMDGRLLDGWPDADLTDLSDLDQWGRSKLDISVTLKETGACICSSGQRPVKLAGSDRPLDHEPLGYLFDSPLTQLADGSNKNIVAALPDEIAERFAIKMAGGMSLRSLCEYLGRYLSFREDSGTLVMAPRKRWQAYAARAKRKPLQELVAAKPVSLDAVCTYVMAQNDCAGATQFEGVVLSLNQCNWVSFQSVEMLGNPSHSFRHKLKFYALLSGLQRTQLVTSGLLYRELSPTQRAAVENWLFGSNCQLSVREAKEDERRTLQVLAREPTITLLNGIPEDTLFKGSLTREMSAMAIAPNGRALMQSCTDLGRMLANQDGEDNPDPHFPAIAMSKLTPGYQSVISVQITYLPNVKDGFALRDMRCEPVEGAVWQSLPEAWLKVFSASADETRRISKIRQQQASPPKIPPPVR